MLSITETETGRRRLVVTCFYRWSYSQNPLTWSEGQPLCQDDSSTNTSTELRYIQHTYSTLPVIHFSYPGDNSEFFCPSLVNFSMPTFISISAGVGCWNNPPKLQYNRSVGAHPLCDFKGLWAVSFSFPGRDAVGMSMLLVLHEQVSNVRAFQLLLIL